MPKELHFCRQRAPTQDELNTCIENAFAVAEELAEDQVMQGTDLRRACCLTCAAPPSIQEACSNCLSLLRPARSPDRVEMAALPQVLRRQCESSSCVKARGYCEFLNGLLGNRAWSRAEQLTPPQRYCAIRVVSVCGVGVLAARCRQMGLPTAFHPCGCDQWP